jgi:integrase
MIHHKPSTQSSERSVIGAQLTPFFGHFELRSINLEMIQRFVNTSEKAPKTVKNAISVLIVIWDQAKAWGYAKHNPFPRGTNGRLLLKLPTVVKGNTYNFTVEESLAIIDKAQGRWKVFFRLYFEAGMRPGELAGLRACDVGQRTLRIAQSVWQQRVQTPKTKNAVRTLALSAPLAETVKELISTSHFSPENEGKREVLLFTTETGRPLSMDNFRNRVLNPILDELGIRSKVRGMGMRCGMYPGRHMNATLMDALNTPMKTRQKRLGHANIETTLKHYTHAQDADDRLAADQIGALLSPKGTKPAEFQDPVPIGVVDSAIVAEIISRQNTCIGDTTVTESAHSEKLMHLSKVTGMSPDQILNRAVENWLAIEAPVYLSGDAVVTE